MVKDRRKKEAVLKEGRLVTQRRRNRGRDDGEACRKSTVKAGGKEEAA